MQSNLPSNKTQCPHCFTIYQITQSQLTQSKGNVRCGNCHERFKAQLLSDDEMQAARLKVVPTNDLFAPDQTADVGTGDAQHSTKTTIGSEPTGVEQKPSEVHVSHDDIDHHNDPVDEPTREPSSDSFSEPSSDSFSEPSSDSFSEPSSDSFSEPSSDSFSEPSTDSFSEPSTDSISEPSSDSISEPSSDSFSEPSSDSFSEPSSDSFKDSFNALFDEPLTSSSESAPRELSLERRETERTTRAKVEKPKNVGRQDPIFNFELEDSEIELPRSDENSRYEPNLDEDEEDQTTFEFDGLDLNFEPDTESADHSELTAEIDSETSLADDNQQQINEIDRIIEDRLIGESERPTTRSSRGADKPRIEREPVKAINWGNEIAQDNQTEDADFDSENNSEVSWADEDDLFIEPNHNNVESRFSVGSLFKTVLSVAVLALLVLLVAYQVWLKQFGFVSNSESIQSNLNSVLVPILNHLDGHGYKLARPSNLNGIALISAVSEPHPSRAGTTLMRVSFLNRSSIEQTLPWVELTLTDEDGKVVSRRAFKPEDYLFNNSTQANIGPHELKKVTIELLAFPKMATGFELKMLENSAP